MKPIVKDFVRRYRELGLSGRSMDEETVGRLEEHLGLELPPAYRAYLAIAGSYPPPKMVGSDCHGERLFKLREWAVELLEESGNPLPLPEDAVVFHMHQGYQFFYFRADGSTDDPAVYDYLEDRPAYERRYEEFSGFVAEIS